VACLPPDSVALAPLSSPVADLAARRRWQSWPGKLRARDLLCLAGIALSGLYSLAMIPLTPALIATRPLLLELLSGSTSSIMAAGAFSEVDSKLQLTAVVAAALPGTMKFDLLFWPAAIRSSKPSTIRIPAVTRILAEILSLAVACAGARAIYTGTSTRGVVASAISRWCWPRGRCR
jgi:hypothetical protein